MSDPYPVPRPTDDVQAHALKRSADAGRPGKWLYTNDLLVGSGVLASVIGVAAGVVTAFLHYPAACDSGGVLTTDSSGACYTHVYAGVGIGIIAVSVALLIAVIMLNRLLRTMPALVVATGAYQYLDGTKSASGPPENTAADH